MIGFQQDLYQFYVLLLGLLLRFALLACPRVVLGTTYEIEPAGTFTRDIPFTALLVKRIKLEKDSIVRFLAELLDSLLSLDKSHFERRRGHGRTLTNMMYRVQVRIKGIEKAVTRLRDGL